MTNDAEGRAWGSQAEAAGSPLEPIAKIDPGPPKRFFLLCDRVEKVDVHYWGGKTIPCLRPPLRCRVPHNETTLRAQYWVAVQPEGRPEMHYLALSMAAADDCPDIVDPKTALYGRELLVGRSGNGKNGRLYAKLGSQRPTSYRLLPRANVVLFLRRLWFSTIRIAELELAESTKWEEAKAQGSPDASKQRVIDLAKQIGRLP